MRQRTCVSAARLSMQFRFPIGPFMTAEDLGRADLDSLDKEWG